uniref:GST N-terminal domain-containing protein n=1 Tax=Oryza nivara TaxID=4536 RepID=A0A0E0GKV6_ORYNI
MAAAAAPRSSGKEALPAALGSASEPPRLFDGTTRLYICYFCPFAQRAWITRNFKGLQDKIELVGIDLQDKPAWYKEKVYEQGTVPSLEHNGKIMGESLDLIKYIDSHFEGPALLPEVRQRNSVILRRDSLLMSLLLAALDKIEAALSKFGDGPFFLGQFSLDVSKIYYSHIRKYEITNGRPNLEKFIEEINRIEAYTQTKNDPLYLLDLAKTHLKARPLPETNAQPPQL